MFAIVKGNSFKVQYARTGKKSDGTDYAVVAIRECDNQPQNSENPSQSKSIVKMWLEKLPKGVADGCTIKIEDFDGFNWLHLPNEYNGKIFYRDEMALVGAKIKLMPEQA